MTRAHGERVPGALGTGLRLGGRMDRYVAKLFVGSYAVALLLVVGIFVILDLASNLDDYLATGPDGTTPSGWLVLEAYLYNTPFLFLQVAPFVTLVGGLFTVTKLMKAREVVAALGAGVSSRRMLLPVFLGGMLLGLSMFGLREWATESLGSRRDGLFDYLETRRERPLLDDLWVKDATGNPVRIDTFYPASEGAPARIEGLGATLRQGERWTNVVARSAVYVNGSWSLEEGYREDVDSSVRSREELTELGAFSFSPRDIRTAWRAREQPTELSFSETTELLSRDPDNVQWQTLLQTNLSFPFAHLVLLLVGLPFLLRHDRSKGPEGAGMGFILCVFYFAADFIARSMGLEGELGPLLAAWLPILFFGSLGVVLFSSART